MMTRRSFFGGLAGLCVFRRAIARCGAAAPAALERSPRNPGAADGDEWAWWRNLPRTVLTASDDQVAAALIRAAEDRRSVRVVYGGGSEPGATRTVSPLGVFKVEGYPGTYAAAFCHKRGAERTFRVERITALC